MNDKEILDIEKLEYKQLRSILNKQTKSHKKELKEFEFRIDKLTHICAELLTENKHLKNFIKLDDEQKDILLKLIKQYSLKDNV